MLFLMQLASSTVALFATKGGILATVIVAEASTSLLPAEIAPLANLGAIGCVLLWFMLRSEPRMQKQTEALDRLTKMNGYVIIALESSIPAVKKQVQSLIEEVEAEEARRKK
jgi:hypothetical protein